MKFTLAFEESAEELSRRHVRKWYQGNYDWEVPKYIDFFSQDEQDEALCKIGMFGSRRDFAHCAKDTEELKVAPARAKS